MTYKISVNKHSLFTKYPNLVLTTFSNIYRNLMHPNNSLKNRVLKLKSCVWSCLFFIVEPKWNLRHNKDIISIEAHVVTRTLGPQICKFKRRLKTCLIFISTKTQTFGIQLNHNASSITFLQILMYPNYDIQIFEILNCKVLNLTYLMCLKPSHFQNKIWDMETWSTFWNAKKRASNKHTR